MARTKPHRGPPFGPRTPDPNLKSNQLGMAHQVQPKSQPILAKTHLAQSKPQNPLGPLHHQPKPQTTQPISILGLTRDRPNLTWARTILGPSPR